MPIGLVASPPETGKSEHDLPPVGSDFAVRIAHETAMIGVVEKEASERTNRGSHDESKWGWQAVRAEHPGGRNNERKRQRNGGAQTGFVVAQIPLDEPAGDAEEESGDSERRDRRGVRIVQ